MERLVFDDRMVEVPVEHAVAKEEVRIVEVENLVYQDRVIEASSDPQGGGPRISSAGP